MSVRYFESHESRASAFELLTGIDLAHPIEGVGSVLGHSTNWYLKGKDPFPRTVVIPPDPSLALVFPTLAGDLAAACQASNNVQKKESISAALAEVGLSEEKLHQPSRTLSGGERCLAAIAKSNLLAECSDQIIACNPEQWLAPEKRPLLQQLLDRYESRPGGWTLLSLDGEMFGPTSGDTREIVDVRHTESVADSRLSFVANDATVDLTDTTGLSEQSPFLMSFSTQPAALELESPVMWSAPNGVGKSVFSQLLCGSLPLRSGTIQLSCNAFSGRARAILQNPVRQLFGKTPKGYLLWSYREALEETRSSVLELYASVEDAIAMKLSARHSRTLIGDRAEPNSLLQARIALAAARLGTRIPLLILDEPGFGLTRDAAEAFVEVVAGLCHERQTGLLILSHTPDWFSGVARSTLSFTRNDVVALSGIHAFVTLRQEQ